MTDLTKIEAKVRPLIGDMIKTGRDIFTYTSNGVFTLTEPNALSVISVYKNGLAYNTSGKWAFDVPTGKLTVVGCAMNDVIEAVFTYYNQYSSAEIASYIDAALVHISSNNYETFEVQSGGTTIAPVPEAREFNLIAVVTSILINPDNVTVRMPDFQKVVPVSSTLSTHEMIRRTISVFKKDSHGIFSVAESLTYDPFFVTY
jgi:hypothetical protein